MKTSAMQCTWGVVAVAALVMPGASQAGDSAQFSPECVKYSDGSGYCRGSMKGFRNSSFADSWAGFEVEVTTGWSFFYAKHNGVNYACYPDSATSARFASAVASNGYFKVSWNASAICTGMRVLNDSSSY